MTTDSVTTDNGPAGLHASDTERLLAVLHSLVDRGHTVITVSHSLHVIRSADWVIDIGPDGGRLVAADPPEAVMAVPASHTGRFLKTALAP